MFYYKRLSENKVISIQTSLLCLETYENFIEITEEEYNRISEELSKTTLPTSSDEISPEEFLQLLEENF